MSNNCEHQNDLLQELPWIPIDVAGELYITLTTCQFCHLAIDLQERCTSLAAETYAESGKRETYAEDRK